MAQDSANGRDPGRWDGKQANRLVTCDKTQVKCRMYLRLHDLLDCDLQKEVATCTKATEIKSESASPEIPISHQLGRRGETGLTQNFNIKLLDKDPASQHTSFAKQNKMIPMLLIISRNTDADKSAPCTAT